MLRQTAFSFPPDRRYSTRSTARRHGVPPRKAGPGRSDDDHHCERIAPLRPAGRPVPRWWLWKSPAKARTIGRYLGDGYRVMSTRGHVRDPQAKAGSVKPEDGSATVYETGKRAARILGAIAKEGPAFRPALSRLDGMEIDDGGLAAGTIAEAAATHTDADRTRRAHRHRLCADRGDRRRRPCLDLGQCGAVTRFDGREGVQETISTVHPMRLSAGRSMSAGPSISARLPPMRRRRASRHPLASASALPRSMIASKASESVMAGPPSRPKLVRTALSCSASNTRPMPFTDRPVVNNSTVANTTPPVLAGAEVKAQGDVIRLTFNEDLDIAQFEVPPASAVTVKADGAVVTVQAVLPSFGFDKLTLELSTGAIKEDQTVTVSYAVPGTGNVIEDTDGYDAESFTDRPVVNNSNVQVTGPGVTVSKTAVTVTEEDTAGDSYTVVLDIQPTANVRVTVAGHTGTDVTPNPTILTFTTSNWNTARTVTVKAGNDADAEYDTVTLTHSATSTDTDYSGIEIARVTVTVNDNDTAQVTGVTVVPGNARLAVSWTAVDSATGYKVPWKSGSQGYNSNRQATVTPGSTASHTIAGLANGTAYTVRVIATRTGANDGPPDDDGGAPITRYEYTRDEGASHAAAGGGDARTHTVSGLKNFTDYTFRVRAVNRIGAGAWSAPHTVRPVPLTLTVVAEKEEVTEGKPVRYRIVMSNPTPGVDVGEVYRYEGEFLRHAQSSTITGIRSHGGVLYWEVERDTVDDAVAEANGTFTVQLQPGDGYTLGTASSVTVKILDDDGEPPGPVVTEAHLASGPGPDGAWRAGDTVEAVVRFSEAVTVDTSGGTPALAIVLGGERRQAVYAGGSGTAALVFRHVVGAADDGARSARVVAGGLSLNGATIRKRPALAVGH